MPATVSKSITPLFSLILFFFASPTFSCGYYCNCKSIMHFFFSIWPPVAVNIHHFLVYAIDGLGGGYRRNTPFFLGQDQHFSGAHGGCGECGFYVIQISVCRRVCPEVPSNRSGHLSCQSWGSVTRCLRSTGGLAETLNQRFREKWPRSLTGADTMLWSEIGRKEGWGCAVTFRTSCDPAVSFRRFKVLIRHSWVCKKTCSQWLGHGC